MKKIITLSLAISAMAAAQAGVTYPYVFAPQEGLVSEYESPVRSEICLNGYWDFQAVPLPESYKQGKGEAPEMPMPSANGWDATRIKIPSPWNINAFGNRNLEGPDHRNYPSYPKEWEDVLMAWMKKTVEVPASWSGQEILLYFEAVAGEAQVYVNGHKVGENFDLFLPFTLDVTPYVTPGEKAEVLVGVRSQKLFEDNSTIGRRLVPAGSMWGYLVNGIWQDVFMLAVPKVRIADMYVKPLVSAGKLDVEVTLVNNSDKPQRVQAMLDVRRWINLAGREINSAPVPNYEIGESALTAAMQPTEVPASDTITTTVSIPVAEGDLQYWTPESPNLYMLQASLSTCGKKPVEIDRNNKRFGWREWTINGTDYCLNGKVYHLKGDSWHFMGVPQLTRRYPYAWYTAIKDMNGNAVRLHAQVYPQFYLDMADEMGICVLDETANWASDGGPKLDSDIFWENSKDHLRRFVLRDRNHPSIFGWSISNENKPVILYVYNRPDLMPGQMQAWEDWRDICMELDPTRPWISADGEDDGDGLLPVTVGHYGDKGSMKNWKGIGKPWGVGEHSMAYYGTPEQVSKYNGERAYESALGRMEGLANECYNLLADQRNMGASYSTVFNMAWYANQPLPLGKADLTTAPTLDDGIFFGEYVEGRPGVQPERMGPYCTTFNPGYDASLPLYRTWPMFDAMRAANAPAGPAACEWAEVTPVAQAVVPHTATPYAQVVFVGEADSPVKGIFEEQGVKFVTKLNKKQPGLYVVDASKPIVDVAALKQAASGANCVWLWGVTPETAEQVSEIAGYQVDMEPLVRSSFIPAKHWLANGLKNSDLYYCGLQRSDASRYSLSGPLVDAGEVAIDACRTNWRAWNNRPEELKTAAVLRSENECTAATPVVVTNGNVIVSTITNFTHSEKGFNALATILANLGVVTEALEVDAAEMFFLRDGQYVFPSNTAAHVNDGDLTFYVFSPRALDDLLIEPDMPKLTLSVNKPGAKLAINGREIDNASSNRDRTTYHELPLAQGWNTVTIKARGRDINGQFTCDNRREFLSQIKASFTNPEQK